MADTLKDIFGDQESVESLDDIFASETTEEERQANILPQVTEAVGSMAGAAVPGVGIATSALGAGVGSAVGDVAEQAGAGFSPASGLVYPGTPNIQAANIETMIGGVIGNVGEFISADRDIAKDIIRKSAVAAGTDLAFGATAGVVGKIANKVNKGVARGLFGKEVADRFFARTDEVLKRIKGEPDELAKKAGDFFGGLTKKLGGDVETLVKSSKKISSLDNQIKAIADFTENGAAIEFLDIPRNQKNKIRTIAQDIASFKGKNVNAETVWELRKGIDNVIGKTSRTSEARSVLYKMRGEMANKLKTFDSNISDVFKKYEFSKQSENELARYYKNIETPDGKNISRNLERFTKNLLRSDQSETIRLLTEIDGMADVDKRIAVEILDEAAKEGIMKDIGGGVVSRVVLQQLGGSQNIAKFLAAPKSAQAIAIERAIRAAGGTGATAALTRE